MVSLPAPARGESASSERHEGGARSRPGRACDPLPEEGVARTSDEKELYARQFPIHVGVDTGKTFHQLVARGRNGRRKKAIRVDVSRR